MEFVFAYTGQIKDLEAVRKKIFEIYEPIRVKLREGEDKKGIPTKWNSLSVLLIDEPKSNELVVKPSGNFVNLFERAKAPGFSAGGAKFKSPVKRDVGAYVHTKIEMKAGGRKWETLEHQGVYFGEPYQPLGVKFSGKIIPDEDEEYLYMYAVRRASEKANANNIQYTQDLLFIKNYLADLEQFVSKSTWAIVKPHVPKTEKNIPAFNALFDNMVAKIEEIKANKKKAGEKEKEKAASIKRKYGVAVVDGRVEQVGNFNVEKPGLLLGRGDNPRRGCLKPRIHSSDVTINIGEKAPVPVPSDGGKWKSVVHNHDVTWMAMWEDRCGNTTKYVWLNPASAFKASNAQLKFEKARKLGQRVDDLEKEYLKLMKSHSESERQIGTIVYLIHQFAFRVGNEKGQDETDTVGATTLRVEHVEPVKPTKDTPKMITFDFLGKDSMQYRNTNNVSDLAYENVVSFRKGKKKEDLLFDRVKSGDVNEFLKKFGDGMSAKVIRTYKASNTYYEALKKGAKKGMSKDQLLDLEKRANYDVAKVCNHQKKKSATAEASIEKIKTKIKEIKAKLKEASANQKEKIKAQLEKEELKLVDKERQLEVACGTSKQNYIDPRITVAFAKTHGLDIPKVFSAAALRTRFAWAIENTEKDWDYIKTPIELPEGDLDLSESEKPKKTRKKAESPKKPKKAESPKKPKKAESPKKPKKAESPKKPKKAESPKKTKKAESPKKAKKAKKAGSPKKIPSPVSSGSEDVPSSGFSESVSEQVPVAKAAKPKAVAKAKAKKLAIKSSSPGSGSRSSKGSGSKGDVKIVVEFEEVEESVKKSKIRTAPKSKAAPKREAKKLVIEPPPKGLRGKTLKATKAATDILNQHHESEYATQKREIAIQNRENDYRKYGLMLRHFSFTPERMEQVFEAIKKSIAEKKLLPELDVDDFTIQNRQKIETVNLIPLFDISPVGFEIKSKKFLEEQFASEVLSFLNSMGFFLEQMITPDTYYNIQRNEFIRKHAGRVLRERRLAEEEINVITEALKNFSESKRLIPLLTKLKGHRSEALKQALEERFGRETPTKRKPKTPSSPPKVKAKAKAKSKK